MSATASPRSGAPSREPRERGPHVLALITSSDFGGAETVMAEVALRRHRSGLPTSVCSLRPAGAVARRLAAEGVPVFSLGMAPGLELGQLPGALARLRRLVRECGVEVIHAHLSRACLLASLLKGLPGPAPPVVSTLHTTSAAIGAGRWRDRAMWLTLRLSVPWTDCYVAVSDEVARALRTRAGIPPDKLATIVNGVDAERFVPSGNGSGGVAGAAAADVAAAGATAGAVPADAPDRRPLTVGSLGRFSRTKGYEVLLRTVAGLDRGRRPLRCLLVGGGEEEAALRRLADDLGIGSRVDLRRFAERPEEVFRELDLFVLPSLEEGLPMALLEAMAAGLAVVASDVGSVGSLVEDGVSGLLVPPGDEAALGAALARLAADPPLRHRLGAAARRRVAGRFSIEAMAAGYEELFRAHREAAGNSRGRSAAPGPDAASCRPRAEASSAPTSKLHERGSAPLPATHPTEVGSESASARDPASPSAATSVHRSRPAAFARLRLRRLVLAAAMTVTAVFTLLRFVDLGADFPPGVTQSHALYTDEGWYSTAAIRHQVDGDWYLAGDMNNAVAVPGFQLVQALNFRLFGMSLVTARIPGALMAVGVVLLAALLLRRRDAVAAVAAALVLAAHSHLFAYSRVALLEVPLTFLALLAACLLLAAPPSALPERPGGRRRQLVLAAAAGLAAAAAIAVKPTALFAVPPLALAAWAVGGAGRLRRTVAFTAGLGLPLTAFYLLLVRRYPQDWRSFWGMVGGKDGGGSLESLLRNAWGVLGEMAAADPLLVAGLVLAPALLAFSSRPRRRLLRHPLLPLAAGLWLCYLGILSTTSVRATRYLVPLIVLSVLLLGAALAHLRREGRRRAAAVLAALMLVGAAVQALRTLGHFRHRDHSFARMSEDVARRVGEDGVLMGDGALQVALATGVRGVNGERGTASLAWRAVHFQPSHYLHTGPLPEEVRQVLERFHHLEREAAYDVFANYQRGRPVHLYRLTPWGEGGRPAASPPGARPPDAAASAGDGG